MIPHESLSPLTTYIYFEQLLASLSIHAPAEPPEDGWPFVCKTVQANISRSCVDYTTYFWRHGHFLVDKDDCTAQRTLKRPKVSPYVIQILCLMSLNFP